MSESSCDSSVEEEDDFEPEEDIAGPSGVRRTERQVQELQEESSSYVSTDEEGCIGDVELLESDPSEWVDFSEERARFPAKYVAGCKGTLISKTDPLEIFEHFFDDEICDEISAQANIYADQKINEKGILKMIKRRSREKDWVETNKVEIKLFFGILLLQGIIKKPRNTLKILQLKVEQMKPIAQMKYGKKKGLTSLGSGTTGGRRPSPVAIGPDEERPVIPLFAEGATTYSVSVTSEAPPDSSGIGC
ncbi:hypothetical protein J437_LFUL018361 [Ladona fulva]|uniref:PiggyBac transposable element-derived protein domain-containing protein n=1 Tax=Ladona fulva TaxID=123851 RepID=A0A8K0PAX8_LADFU|nr:hypothetical protein J437_LFUL018361 [Ladona fulva]